MSYDFEKDNQQYLNATGTVLVSAYPFTMAVKFKCESRADNDTVFSLGQAADGSPFARFVMNSSNQLVGYRRTRGGSVTGDLNPGVTIALDTWYSAVMICDRYLHKVWVNTTASADFTTDMNVWSNDNLDRVGVGVLYYGSGLQGYADMKIAEAAIWAGTAFGTTEVTSYSNGTIASAIAGGPTHWWRFNTDKGTPYAADAGGISLSASASAPVYAADHPTITAGGGFNLAQGSQKLAMTGVVALSGNIGKTVPFSLVQAAQKLGLTGLVNITGNIGRVGRYWRVPTNAAQGTQVNVIVLDGSRNNYSILAQGNATVDASGYATLPGNGSAGQHAFALVHDYNDNPGVATIYSGGGVGDFIVLT